MSLFFRCRKRNNVVEDESDPSKNFDDGVLRGMHRSSCSCSACSLVIRELQDRINESRDTESLCSLVIRELQDRINEGGDTESLCSLVRRELQDRINEKKPVFLEDIWTDQLVSIKMVAKAKAQRLRDMKNQFDNYEEHDDDYKLRKEIEWREERRELNQKHDLAIQKIKSGRDQELKEFKIAFSQTKQMFVQDIVDSILNVEPRMHDSFMVVTKLGSLDKAQLK